jgi:ferredoxin-thioredoxin reductase catalytic subunit
MIVCKLNPDKETVQVIKEGLKEKEGFCPCVLGKPEEAKCPCKEFKEKKICRCGLFVCEEK